MVYKLSWEGVLAKHNQYTWCVPESHLEDAKSMRPDFYMQHHYRDKISTTAYAK